MNLVVFGCGAVQHADKVCEHSTACRCIFLLSAPFLVSTTLVGKSISKKKRTLNANFS